MISFFRRIIGSRFGAVIALVFVGLIAVGFALGDVTGSTSFGGLGGANVARVGNADITLGEFNQALENRLRAEQKENPTLAMPNFVESGGLDGTLEQLINRYALAVFGTENGVAVSKRLIDYEIRNLPQAKGLDGKFSEESFRAFLGQLGLTEKMVRDDYTQNLFAQQILPIANKGGGAPASLVLPYASLSLEKRSGQVAVIPSAAFLPKDPPSEAILSQYYRSNTIKFTVPEKRAVSYAIFGADIVAGRAKPTAAEIEAYYKTNAATYAATQTRDISQIIVPTEAAAKSVIDKIAAGQPLAAAAKEIGLSVSSIKAVQKNAVEASSSKAVADAIFAAGQGTMAKPTKGGLGWFVVRVDAVQQVAARPLAAVSGEIEKTLLEKKKSDTLNELTSELENEFEGGATIADMANAQGLKVETSPLLLANGANTKDQNYRPIPEMRVILPAVFDMERDGNAQLIEIEAGKRFAMVSVADVEEAAPPPLATVRNEVMQLWAQEQGSKKAKVAAEQVQKAIIGGKSLNEALAALGIRLPNPQSVAGTRAELRAEGKPMSPPLALMFSMKLNSAKTLAAPGDAGWFIVHLNQIIKGDASQNAPMIASAQGEFTKLLQEEYTVQFINAAAAAVGVKKNDSGIAELRASLTKRDSE